MASNSVYQLDHRSRESSVRLTGPKPAITPRDMGIPQEAIMKTEDYPAQANGFPGTDGDFAHRFVAALAAKNSPALQSMFGSEVDFRAVTPGRVWEAGTAQAVNQMILGTWFGPGTVIERIESVESSTIGTRCRIGYRLRLANADGKFIVEQQAFADRTGDKITELRLACSGFVPVSEN